MPSKGSRGALGFSNNQLADALDEVAKGLAAGTISRGRAIRLGGAALLGSMGLLSLFPAVSEAEVQGACEGRAVVNNKVCPAIELTRCRPNSGRSCSCFKTVSGNTRCIDVTGGLDCPTTDECDRNRDCPGDQVCVKIGGCCEGSRRNVCANPCP
jgi:hypothetical protein